MKNLIFYTAFISCLILPVSCLTTLQPLVTDNNIITDERITGNWQYEDATIQIKKLEQLLEMENDRDLRIITRNTRHSGTTNSVFLSKTYELTFNKNGVLYSMVGAITSIQNDLFIEFSPMLVNDPKNAEGSGFEWNNTYLPSFTIARLHIKNNHAIDIQFLNGDFIKEQIRAGNMRIKHEHNDLFNTFLITASSSELKQFLEKYGNDDRLYSTQNSITLTKKW
jgi:hypothetical protein